MKEIFRAQIYNNIEKKKIEFWLDKDTSIYYTDYSYEFLAYLFSNK